MTFQSPFRDRNFLARGIDSLISDALLFGRLWYNGSNAISYAKFYSRSHDAVIHVDDAAGNVIDAHWEDGFSGTTLNALLPKVAAKIFPVTG